MVVLDSYLHCGFATREKMNQIHRRPGIPQQVARDTLQ